MTNDRPQDSDPIGGSIVARLNLLRDRIEEFAASNEICSLDLRLRVGLHLPRLWDEGKWADAAAETEEIVRLSREVSVKQAEFRYLSSEPPRQIELNELHFAEMRHGEVESIARPILERFHYINSFRNNSRHFGLSETSGRIAAMATLSPFDLNQFERELLKRCGSRWCPAQSAVVSRIYAFRWAPQNCISHLLSKLVRTINTEALPIRTLLTYLNPNLGLTGASYRAAGWRLFAREANEGYAYIDRRYITDRRLEELRQETNKEKWKTMFESRLHRTTFPLQPLDVYGTGWGRCANIFAESSATAAGK
jgi:hypothetical protein